MGQVTVGFGPPVEVVTDEVAGAVFMNHGPATVSYSDSQNVRDVAEGSLASGASATLYGSVWLYAPARADVGFVPLLPTVEIGSGLPDGGQVGDFLTNTAPGEGDWSPVLGHGPIPAPLLGETDDTPLVHVWGVGDVPDPETAIHGGWLEYVTNWTPTESGTVLLTAPAWDGTTEPNASVEYRIYDIEPHDPEAMLLAKAFWYADAGPGDIFDPPLIEFEVAADAIELVADQTYWLAVLNVEGEAAFGRTVSLREWATSVMYLGGAQLFSWRPEAEGYLSVAEGYETQAEELSAHAEGHGSYADSIASHAEGAYTRATGLYSHAEGGYTHAAGYASHAEGANNVAGGKWSHAEGYAASAAGDTSHAEGQYARAVGPAAHAEGNSSLADGYASHAEGSVSRADGTASHAEGTSTRASGANAHAEGYGSWAAADHSHASGTGAKARDEGARAHGGGNWTGGAFGEAQHVAVVRRVATTDDTETVLAVLTVANDRVVGLRAMVAARSTDGTLGAAWFVKGTARIDGAGAVTILGVPTVESIGADVGAATWAVDVVASPFGAPAVLGVVVTGAAATTIHWSAAVETQEVG